MNFRQALDGARIVVARAAGRDESLCARIDHAGGHALGFRVIDIHPLENPALPGGSPTWLVFTSSAAVEYGLRALPAEHLSKARTAVVGNATANALRAAGIEPDAIPEREESEGLLAMPEFWDVGGKAFWLVKGRGGRALLRETLRERGAEVALFDVYERCLPETDPTVLLERWRAGRVDAIVVSSGAGLENLHALLDTEGRRYLQETQLVVPTPRMLKLALEFDIRPIPIIAAGASDEALMSALAGWWRDRFQDSR